ncbi:hypothetical protein FN976_15980 [Caenimonas sedimenti]|uniref:Uncharacterized protein n=1 Tax=Caenimonas sedimenti TaxID=2596921 RepID=A0A562ZQM3_9BURK|nr:hypothetical protein [Caenimonas sedimenti]TWO70474.1 hypothetical protein FN976_15980 [Caenimonas sedimenti]
MKSFRWLAALAAASAFALPALPVHADAASLRARHADLRDELRNNNYQRALHIDSTESPNVLQGDVYAVLDHPFVKVSQALKEPAAWCDIMILPFNTKYCHAGGDQLQVRIGRKYNQPAEQAFKLSFGFRNQIVGKDYFETRLNAPEGPIGTRDYRITVSAIPLEAGKTFLHLSYSYGYGTVGRMAMQTYLSTAGASKVGFSMSKDANGQPVLTGGVRGAVERNAMRYYLAIDSYLETLDAPADQRNEKRIQSWFSATERYPKQLHEMDRSTYVTMKRQEYERQQTAMN